MILLGRTNIIFTSDSLTKLHITNPMFLKYASQRRSRLRVTAVQLRIALEQLTALADVLEGWYTALPG